MVIVGVLIASSTVQCLHEHRLGLVGTIIAILSAGANNNQAFMHEESAVLHVQNFL